MKIRLRLKELTLIRMAELDPDKKYKIIGVVKNSGQIDEIGENTRNIHQTQQFYITEVFDLETEMLKLIKVNKLKEKRLFSQLCQKT